MARVLVTKMSVGWIRNTKELKGYLTRCSDNQRTTNTQRGVAFVLTKSVAAEGATTCGRHPILERGDFTTPYFSKTAFLVC